MTVTSEDLDIRTKDVRLKIVAAVKGDSNIIGYVKDRSKISFNDGKKKISGEDSASQVSSVRVSR